MQISPLARFNMYILYILCTHINVHTMAYARNEMRRVPRTLETKYTFGGCQMLIIVHYLTSSKPVNTRIERIDIKYQLLKKFMNY